MRTIQSHPERFTISRNAVPRVALVLAGIAPLLAAPFAGATVLPEERADLMYHRYDGGDVTVDGPSVLVRKNIGDKVSVSANYTPISYPPLRSTYKPRRAHTRKHATNTVCRPMY